MNDPSKQLNEERAERIRQRRERIAARRAKKSAGDVASADSLQSKKDDHNSRPKQQITASRETVDQAYHQAVDSAVALLAAARRGECTRRQKEAQARRERIELLENEVRASTALNQEIESQWAEIAKLEVVEDLYNSVSEQFKKAKVLKDRKNDIISQLRAQLKRQDEMYVALLRDHSKALTTVTELNKKEFSQMVKTCQEELDKVENVFLEQRSELLNTNRAEVNELFEQRRTMELALLDQRAEREKSHHDVLTEMRNRDAADYNKMKVILEKNIQLLEVQLEEMRATYQLNSEILDYNHEVLQQRDKENRDTVEYHIQKKRSLKDQLSKLQAQFRTQDAAYRVENAKLTKEYRKATEQFKDLQKKFRHFENLDLLKFEQVWEMNEENVMHVVRKVLKADRAIMTQILGLKWLPMFLTADVALEPDGSATSKAITAVTATDLVQTRNLKVGRAGDSSGGVTDGRGRNARSRGLTGILNQYSVDQMRQMIELLLREASFLLDGRVNQQIEQVRAMRSTGDKVGTISEEEVKLIQSDAILSALGVEDPEDLQALMQLFWPDPLKPRLTVDSNDVIPLIKQWVWKRQREGSSAMGERKETAVKSRPRIDPLQREKRARQRARMRAFWEALGNVIDEDAFASWITLERHMHRYVQVLKERQGLIEDTSGLAKQNEELKILIQQYMASQQEQ